MAFGSLSRVGDDTITSRRYQLRVEGVASDLLRAAFDDVEVSDGAGSTILRTGPVDAAALYGLISRIESLGLVLLYLEAIDIGNASSGKRWPNRPWQCR